MFRSALFARHSEGTCPLDRCPYISIPIGGDTDTVMRMRDSEVVACIVAGDPGGLAEAYDRYAALLYTYCCTLLREPADAADVVQDTFLIASDRVAGLRDPDRLRPWLFAVARNECMRRLRDRTSTSAFDETADLTHDTTARGGHATGAERRFLL